MTASQEQQTLPDRLPQSLVEWLARINRTWFGGSRHPGTKVILQHITTHIAEAAYHRTWRREYRVQQHDVGKLVL